MIAAWMLWAACEGEVAPARPADEPPEVVVPEPLPEPPDYAPLEPLRLLVRASLDLRGVRPSLAEIAALDADPSSLDAAIDAYLDDPRFPRRVREVFDEVLLIRDEEPFVDYADLLTTRLPHELWASVAEEPTRMLERIAAEDRPYTEWVTADWTMADEVLADVLPVEYPAGAQGWRASRYLDGRPAAGVLVSSGWWWQQGSMLNNLNRGRANQVSRVLLCFDYLESEIDFAGVSALSSEAALGEAIRTDPACAACHDTLDPIASSLYGFWWPSSAKHDLFDIQTYHPERERLWHTLRGPPPGLHGEAVNGLADLGVRIAAEEDYARCFVEHSWRGLLRREPAPEEEVWIDEVHRAFSDSGLQIREAWRALVRTGAWRNGAGERSPKVVTPAVLSSQIAELTGFRWEERGWDLLRGPVQGYGPLVGGVDGISRSTRLTEPTPTLAVVVAQVAAMAGSYVSRQDLADPDNARLLTRVTGLERVDGGQGEASIRAQVVDLHLRIAAERLAPDDPRVDAELDLWDEIFGVTEDPTAAWAAVVTLLLRHPAVVVY